MSIRTTILAASLGACALVAAAPARAGDCADPSDCQSIPDNATKAGIGIAVATGGALAVRKRTKEKEKAKNQKEKKKIERGGGEATDEDSLFGPGGR